MKNNPSGGSNKQIDANRDKLKIKWSKPVVYSIDINKTNGMSSGPAPDGDFHPTAVTS